jgi:dolichyl-phosphate beta-glucosyltransferase
MNTLSIVIPAYNEEDRIIQTLEKSLDYLNTREYNSEILVVSDGSTDSTASVVNGFDAGQKVNLQFLEYHPNRGKGYAVRYGMLRATYDIVMFMDADYSVEMFEVEKGMKLMAEGADIAIASRAIEGAVVSHHQNFFRELSAKLYTFIQGLYLGIYYKDTQCGFKMFTKDAVARLFSKQLLDSVIFDPEILWLAKKEGLKVTEFPVKWTHMEDSRIQYDSLRKSLFVFEELFRIRKLHRSKN